MTPHASHSYTSSLHHLTHAPPARLAILPRIPIDIPAPKYPSIQIPSPVHPSRTLTPPSPRQRPLQLFPSQTRTSEESASSPQAPTCAEDAAVRTSHRARCAFRVQCKHHRCQKTTDRSIVYATRPSCPNAAKAKRARPNRKTNLARSSSDRSHPDDKRHADVRASEANRRQEDLGQRRLRSDTQKQAQPCESIRDSKLLQRATMARDNGFKASRMTDVGVADARVL